MKLSWYNSLKKYEGLVLFTQKIKSQMYNYIYLYLFSVIFILFAGSLGQK